MRFYARGLLIKTHPRKAPGGQSIDASDYPVERSIYAMRNVDALQRQAEAAGEVIGRDAAALLDADTHDRRPGPRCSGQKAGRRIRAEGPCGHLAVK